MSDSKSDVKGFSKNNTIDVSILRIELLSGEVIDLKNSFSELNTYRNILDLGMTASLIFKDVLNITNNGPILGGEKVYVRFKSTAYNDYTELTLRVSLVAERVPISQTSCMVKLELCSESLYFGLSKTSSVGYNSQYSSLAKKLWDSLGLDVPFFNDETSGLFEGCTTTTFNVLETINQIAARSVDSNNIPFTFFEDYDGVVFASWSKILNQSNSTKMIMQIQGTEENIKKDWMNILAIQFDNNSRDALEFMRSGVANKLKVEYDINTKTKTEKIEKFEDNISLYGLNSGKVQVKDMDKSSRNLFTFVKPDKSNENMSQHESIMFLLQYCTTTICNIGDDKARLGQLIELDLRSPQIPNGNNIDSEQFFSGKYLVSSIKDCIRPNEYRTYRTLIKESLLNEVS